MRKNQDFTLGIDPHTKKFGVGVDIGGTKIRSVLWDGKRAIKAREFRTPKNLTAFKKALRKLPLHLTKGEGSGEVVIKIGIAVPGRARGTVFISATNLPYIRNFNFMRLFPGARVKIDHDARCFAKAEYINARPTLFLTLGTGIGRAVGKDGKVLKIKKFEYPERWEKEYQKIRDAKNNKKSAEFLGKKLNPIITLYRPQIIIAGGGVATRKDFLKLLQKELKVKIKKSKLGKNAAAIGAALL